MEFTWEEFYSSGLTVNASGVYLGFVLRMVSLPMQFWEVSGKSLRGRGLLEASKGPGLKGDAILSENVKKLPTSVTLPYVFEG